MQSNVRPKLSNHVLRYSTQVLLAALSILLFSAAAHAEPYTGSKLPGQKHLAATVAYAPVLIWEPGGDGGMWARDATVRDVEIFGTKQLADDVGYLVYLCATMAFTPYGETLVYSRCSLLLVHRLKNGKWVAHKGGSYENSAWNLVVKG